MLTVFLYGIYMFLATIYIYIRGQLFPKICQSKTSLNGKTVIITGGNTGIGKETALDLAKRGATVIIACRDYQKGLMAATDIRKEVLNANIIVKHLDLASFTSIRRFSEDILKTVPFIHILINNAATFGRDKTKTEDGFEEHFGVNHLGHFLLTTSLLDRIKASAPARIVNVASNAHIFGKTDFNDVNFDQGYYNYFSAYARSKLANILFTRQLAIKLQGTGVTTYTLHPGVADTEFLRYLHSWTYIVNICKRILFMSAYQASQTTIYCAVDESITSESGLYYSDCRKVYPSHVGRDAKLAAKLWNMSENLIESALKKKTY